MEVMATLIDMANDLLDKAKTVVTDGVTCYIHDQLVKMSKLLTVSVVAVTYVRRSKKSSGETRGVATTVTFGLYVMGDSIPCTGTDGSTAVVSILDAIERVKDAIEDTDSPSFHKWTFNSEVPVTYKMDDGSSVMGYVQLWETTQP